jgi:hypothetical protein
MGSPSLLAAPGRLDMPDDIDGSLLAGVLVLTVVLLIKDEEDRSPLISTLLPVCLLLVFVAFRYQLEAYRVLNTHLLAPTHVYG